MKPSLVLKLHRFDKENFPSVVSFLSLSLILSACLISPLLLSYLIFQRVLFSTSGLCQNCFLLYPPRQSPLLQSLALVFKLFIQLVFSSFVF